MATLDQAFIKAYTHARTAATAVPANATGATPPPPRIGLAAIGLKKAGSGAPRVSAGAQAVAAPVTPEPTINAAPFSSVRQVSPVETSSVRHIAPTILESIHTPARIAESVESLPSAPQRSATRAMDDCESFAVSLEGPRVPDLILADTLAVQEAICYCEPAAVDAGFEQSDLLVWHPTTRDMIISEIDMVVVPRVVSPISSLKVADNNTNAAVLEATTEATSFEPPIADPESVTADVPTNRSVIVPPPLPKTLIPPAPEEQFESLPASHGVAATEPIVQIETEPAAEALTSQTGSRQEAITETQTAATETSAAASATRPAFAPLSSFNPRLIGEVVRPQLEVDRFAWPEVCGLLLGRVEADFIRLAEELAARAAHSNQVVAWTGCQRGEGRTTSLLCMAQRLAAAGRKCVLVDADFSRPELARRLGISAQVGWEEVVAGAAQLTDVLIGSLEDRLALLPRRQRVAAGTHPGAGAASAAMFDLLREAFDVVLLDVGPMAGEAELADMASCAAAANVGGAYLVFDSRNITTSEMTATADQLREVGIEVWGAIENFRR